MAEQKKEENNPHSEDDLNIDFSKIKTKLKQFFSKEKDEPYSKKEHHSNEKHKEKDDDISLDFSKIIQFTKKHSMWLIPLFCILIAMSVSIYFRTMPLSMPITDDWAKNTVNNYYKTQIEQQISQQYPNLPQQNKNILIEKELQKTKDQNKAQYDATITQVSQQYKDQFHNEQGDLYLLGIDPWHFYRQTYYLVNNGHPGNTIKEGKNWDSYRLAPLGTENNFDFHPWIGSILYYFMNLFGNFSLVYTFFFIGTIFCALAIIPAFFIGKIVTKSNVGGFFTAILIAVSAFFVQRTTGESSDTDVWVIFFPLLITWFFLEAFHAKELKKKLLWISGAGITTGIFALAWAPGWWYVFDFIIGTIIIYTGYILITNYKDIKTKIKSNEILENIYLLLTYFLTTSIITTILFDIKTSFNGLIGPLSFLSMKSVAVNSVWPNIYTTVAELNVAPMSQVISQLGGKLIFTLAIIGIILTILKKDENGNRDIKTSIFLIIWLCATLYATTKGIRFILQVTPVIAISFGAFLGISWHYLTEWTAKELKVNKIITSITIFLLLSILLIEPISAGYQQAYNSVPSINDAWYNTLKKIDNEAPQNIIITSWWDFGYWFRAIANRPVTFDGGTQVEWDAHFVGKTLLTSNEKQSVGIIRMLNCGQNKAFTELDQILNDTHLELNIIYKITTEDKTKAKETLKKYGLTEEQSNTILLYTHCNAPTDYFITSDDMVGKAGVWGHFGSWNFEKAEMYMYTKNMDQSKAIEYLQTNYNLTEIQAQQTFDEIKSTPADQWIASWPNYFTGLTNCQKQDNQELICNMGTQQGTISLKINLKNFNTTINTPTQEIIHPNSIIYADQEKVKEKVFSEKTTGFSIILIPNDKEYQAILADPSIAASTFTKLFFFNGHGMNCFKKFDEAHPFTGGKILTWIVDYNCQENNPIFFLPQEEVHASHIIISTEKHTPEEALQLIKEIKKNITSNNFEEYAKKYSEDGSANTGGDLGWFAKGMMVKPFEDTAFNLKIGEISEPIQTQFGYHLIILKDKRIAKN